MNYNWKRNHDQHLLSLSFFLRFRISLNCSKQRNKYFLIIVLKKLLNRRINIILNNDKAGIHKDKTKSKSIYFKHSQQKIKFSKR